MYAPKEISVSDAVTGQQVWLGLVPKKQANSLNCFEDGGNGYKLTWHLLILKGTSRYAYATENMN